MVIDNMPARHRFRAAVPARRPSTICAVSLINRRTGSTHRENDVPVIRITRDPAAAVSALLANRDVALWDVRIDPIAVGVRA